MKEVSDFMPNSLVLIGLGHIHIGILSKNAPADRAARSADAIRRLLEENCTSHTLAAKH